MRRTLLIAGLILSMLGVCSPAKSQVIGIVPYPQAIYYWDTVGVQWKPCPNASTAEPSENLPQPVDFQGFNAGLGQWTPYTFCPGGPGGGLASFVSGPLFPLFTTSLGSDPTNNPNLQFALDSTPNATFLANFAGSTAPWAQWTLLQGTNINFGIDAVNKTLTLNSSLSNALSIITDDPILVNGAHGPVVSGTAEISCPTCGATNPTTFITIPTGNYVLIRPHRFTITRRDFAPGSIVGNADGQNASATIVMGSTCSLSYTNIGTFDQFSLADVGLSPSDVIDVQAVAVTGIVGVDTNNFCFPSLADPNWATTSLVSGSASLSLPANQPNPSQQVGPTATGFSGAQVATATMVATMIVTGATRLNTEYDINSVALLIHYSGSPLPAPNRLYVRPPLGFDLTTQSIFLDPNFPQHLNSWPLGHTPDPTLAYGWGIIITGTTDCVNSSGNPNDSAWCKPVNTGGSTFAWGPFPGGGAGGDTITSPASTLTVGGTSTATTLDLNLAHANTWTAAQTFNLGLTIASGHSLTNTGVSDGCATWASGVLGSTGTACGSGGGGFPTGATGGAAYYTGSAGAISSDVLLDQGGIPLQISAAGIPTQWDMTYDAGHAPVPGSSTTSSFAPNSSGQGTLSEAGAAYSRICTAANGVCGSGSGTINSGSGYALPIYGAAAGTTLSPSNITSDATGNNLNVPNQENVGGSLPTNHVTVDAPTISSPWHLNLSSPAIAALSLGGGTAAAGKYIDGGTGNWTTLPTGVTTTGSPASGDIAAFSGAGSITTATVTQVNTLIKTLTGCNTATFVYTPQAGDCVAPSGGTSGFTQIAQNVISGSSTHAITFSSISGSYTSLKIVWNGRIDDSVGNGPLQLQFNGDTGSNYDYNYIFGGFSSGPTNSSVAQVVAVVGCMNGATAAANTAASGTIEIQGYSGTTFYKELTAQDGCETSTTIGQNAVFNRTAQWRNTAAVTSITLTDGQGGHFVSGTTFTLYGMQ